MRLVYFSPVPWDSFEQRPHKFVKWFHSRFGGRVFWVEPYPGRLPRAEDFRWFALRREGASSSCPSWLWVMRRRVFPLEPIPILRNVNRWLWRELVAEIARFVDSERALIVVGKPSMLAVEVLGKCRGSGVATIYDAMDDFPMFYSGLSRWTMGKMEAALVEGVDRVWCSSHALYDKIADVRCDAVLVPNALDRSTMSRSRNIVESHGNERRVFGYVGTIGAWFDWEWVITLAGCFPEDEVRVIGPIHASPPAPLPSNIHLLPPCEQRVALEKMRAFDVALIPFLINGLTASVDPVKYYEYRGLGLPVVSTRFGEMSHRGAEPGVFLSRAYNDIRRVVEKALGFRDDEEQTRMFCETNNWPRRFDDAWANSTMFSDR